MKKIIPISFSLFFVFFVGAFARADDCAELNPVIEAFYKASQNEDIDVYMLVMDQEYLRENLLDNYEDYVKAAWEVYDTKTYELKRYNCKLEENDALMYLNLKSSLVSEGEEVEVQRNYVALFHKTDSWKIRYVMDEDVFSQFQSSLYSQLFLDATKDMIYKEIDNVDAILENAKAVEEVLAGEYDDTISEGVASPSDSKEGGEESGGALKWVIAVLFLGVFGYGAFYVKQKKS